MNEQPPDHTRNAGNSEDDLGRIDVDEYFAHPPAKVWRALTTPALMEQWLMPNDFAPVVGHRFTFHATPIAQTRFSGTIACQVLELVPEELLSISWEDAEKPTDTTEPAMRTTVTWALRAEGHGTRVLLSHVGFDPDAPTQQLARTFMSGGWRSHVLRRLEDFLAELPETPTSQDIPR